MVVVAAAGNRFRRIDGFEMTRRDHIPAEVRRRVLVEAGHRCAIATCRTATTEIAHIIPWSQSRSHSFENLIALCPTCHTRYDRGEIDRLAMRMYKQNLALLNSRYGEFERRVFEHVAVTGRRVFVVGAGGDFFVANAVKDGLFERLPRPGKGLRVELVTGAKDPETGEEFSFPTSFRYYVTDAGVDFIRRFARGESLTHWAGTDLKTPRGT
jgi:hypothetical protein